MQNLPHYIQRLKHTFLYDNVGKTAGLSALVLLLLFGGFLLQRESSRNAAETAVTTDPGVVTTASSDLAAQALASGIKPVRVTIYARGDAGSEVMELRIKDQVVMTWTVNTVLSAYTHDHYETIGATDLKVAFTNDIVTPTLRRNLIVDYITVGDQTFQSEADNVYSLGSWVKGPGCDAGYKKQDILHCNGYFLYSIGNAGVIEVPDPVLAPAPSQATPVNASYANNLAKITGATYRNKNHDGSPYLNTPANAIDMESLFGPRSEYLGNPAGNPEQSFPVANGGQFRTSCEFSHFAYDDPLIHPGQPEKAHLHMFFGNTHVNAMSTYETLFNSGSSTCNGQELNRSGYWVPALFDEKGNVRIPERIVVYYKGEGLARGKSQVYPEGAAMIANLKGDVNAINSGQGGAAGKFSFVCSDQYSGASSPASNTMINCPGSRYAGVRQVLEMNVKFPQCYTGSSPEDFRNSWRIPVEGGWYFSLCNGTHSQTFPNLEYFINYPIEPNENTSGWYLSSDVNPSTFVKDKPSGSTSHADWWGGWNKTVNKMFIDNCVNFRTGAASGCGFGYLTDGGPNNGSPFPGPALKYRPQYTGPIKVPASTIYDELCTATRPFTKPQDAAYCRPGQSH